jgi:DNA-binding NarL/FixJ family response regulator
MNTRVLIADDQALVRAGLKVIINRDPSLTVVGEATTGNQAIEQARALRPDVILMDIRMPRLDGIAATRELLRNDDTADIRVIVLTTFDSDEHIFDALRAGVSGFLLKDTDPDELRRAVHIVASGEALLAPSVTRRLIATYARQPAGRTPAQIEAAGLTNRETEVLALVAHGLTNEEIARDLFVSVATAKTHVNRTMTKLGAHDRAQLVIAAYEAGVIPPGTTRPSRLTF